MNRPCLVDVIFLDIDGVLLPFGGSGDNSSKDNLSFKDGCIFPIGAMDALTTLLQRICDISLGTAASSGLAIRGNPVLVLSSTWRARPEFIQDILSSFRAYNVGDGKSRELNDKDVLKIWDNHQESFFDIIDTNYHATRHDEIYKWVNENKQQRNFSSKHAKVAKKKYLVRSWIALDDEDLVNVEGRISTDAIEHAVQTKSSVGLTNADVNVGVELVKTQMQEFHGIFW